ncbi:putative nuclease HARBI1 [Neoarius graeffei]|uniref:putative nuclease HARBI1 n=1 Tax=Neoarius graeffei TaxID=443677 RepID=UPI00298C77C0|nr:putative nuclease HARBI1 [Neoarius graeffei]
MEAAWLFVLFKYFVEMEEEIEMEHRRQSLRRRRRLYCRLLCQRRAQVRHYCAINATVPVLQRYFGNEDTHPDFALGREAIQQLLVALKTERQHGWGPTLETLVFLFWLVTGSAYRLVSRVFNIPLPTVHRVIHRMADEVVAVLPQFVCLPCTQEEVQVVGEGFAQLARDHVFAKAAGAIDFCYIRIKCPGGPNSHDNRYRKLFPSMVLQAVCDHQGRFIDSFVGYPRSVHDAHILKNSPIYTKRTYPPPGYFILADGSYPCLQEPLALITPYKRPVRGIAEQRFNYHHARAHAIIKHTFGMMKTRFRCIFLEPLEVHPQFVPKVVTACVILHNICLEVGDDLPPEEAVQKEDDQPPAECEVGDSQNGAAWRTALANEVSSLQEAPLDHDYFAQS